MQSIDTNVVVRLVVQDDEAQARRAEDVFRKALGADGVRMTPLVLAETVWVLRSGYKFERSKVVEVLQWLLAIEGLTVESDSEVRAALAAFETGPADFADYLILESARTARGIPLWTFDENLALSTGAQMVP